MWTNKLLAVAIVGALSGCGSSSSEDSAQQSPTPNVVTTQNVEIKFVARVGNEAISCEPMQTSVGQKNQTPEFKDARIYISEVALINDADEVVSVTLNQDKRWQYKNVALLDFETGTGSCSNGNPALNNVIKGTVPSGNYNGIQFTLGVPAELNNYGIDGDDAVSPLDVLGMNWSWQAGHKHLRMDIKGLMIHLGTTGCELVDADAETVDCSSSRPNRPQYQFDSFNPASNSIVFDYQKLVAGNYIDDTTSTCMSSNRDTVCQPIFDGLGLDLTSGKCVAGDCSAAQTWITVEE
ncbi:MbnP family copper-binding protein [Moritella sp.]|uniref:MbnP family copper-binding protein n=1 Tax=Moritella sp. TaxID=78556 RepID=UPI001D92A038|nr:MbnP family copper-binding protein [Moritella sp.]MCJ8350472.1 metallo-mystery pair system four-Cys motif protein [Moritella sp.]NQZ42622.1 metallo-mystery pair system four-Cys motif protein [Moritella sp.]